MKYVAIVVFLVISIVSCGQSDTKSTRNKLKVKAHSISRIEVANYCGPMDSCQMVTYQLSDSMTKELVDKLNQSDATGPCEFSCEYWLHLYFKDGTKQTYITNGSLLSEVDENDDYPSYTYSGTADDTCLKLKDSQYLVNLWTELMRTAEK